jgi:hypothetical protein
MISIRSNRIAAVLAGVVWMGMAGSAMAASAAEEVAELKAALVALQARLEQLEAQVRSTEETNDRQTDQIAAARASVGSWVPNYTLKGDFRYRFESVEQDGVANRNRDRLRVRAGFEARVNERVRAEFVLSTSEGNDARSSNQTLTNANSRKSVFIDQASVDWRVAPSLKLVAGKMKYPWERPGTSAFFDADINPEGLAAMWNSGDFFGSAIYNLLEERSSAAESVMTGIQAGWRPAVGPGRLTLAGAYFDFHSVQHRAAFPNGNANGNSTTSVGCFGGAASCLAHDYDLIEAFAEYSRPVANRPLALFADFMTNEAADNGLDTAWALGLNYGKASEPRSWEVGYLYQTVQKDALFGAFVDSDLGHGNTDYRAHMLRAGYAVAKNWLVNVSYQFATTQIDVPASVGGSPSAADRDYDRLHVDLNFKF